MGYYISTYVLESYTGSNKRDAARFSIIDNLEARRAILLATLRSSSCLLAISAGTQLGARGHLQDDDDDFQQL